MFRPTNYKILVILSCIFLISCSSATATTSPQVITAYFTSSAESWMNDLFTCANAQNVTVRIDAEKPDIFLRIGEPEGLSSNAYQIDEEELLVVTNRESPVQNLSLEQVQALFAGQGDPSAQVWVYSSELDVQGLFDQFVMQGRSVTSIAKVAVNPQEMSDILNTQSNAVGILPRHWKSGSVREVYSVGKFPVLAIVKNDLKPVGETLISCLQK